MFSFFPNWTVIFGLTQMIFRLKKGVCVHYSMYNISVFTIKSLIFQVYNLVSINQSIFNSSIWASHWIHHKNKKKNWYHLIFYFIGSWWIYGVIRKCSIKSRICQVHGTFFYYLFILLPRGNDNQFKFFDLLIGYVDKIHWHFIVNIVPRYISEN